MSIVPEKRGLAKQVAVRDGLHLSSCPGPMTTIQLVMGKTSAVRPRKLPYKPVIGELENRTELRFLKPLALGAWTYVSGSPTAKARESIALRSAT